MMLPKKLAIKPPHQTWSSVFNSRVQRSTLWCGGESGFTLLEMVLVIGLMAIIFAFTLPVGMNFYRSYSFQTEVNTVIALLEQARSSAMANQNESAWGFYIDDNNFTIFRGPSYASRYAPADKLFDRASDITIAGSNEVVFNQLSGRATTASLTISGNNRTANISVNSEGVINY